MISNKHFLTELYENTNKLGELVDDFEKFELNVTVITNPTILVSYVPEEVKCFTFKSQILKIFG